MKRSEAARIRSLISAREPRPNVEEVVIERISMLVIIGNEVDTVVRYNRSGAADMPQLASYPEIAESAAYADERLARQRASGRANTTGEGKDWPRNWKLASAKAAGKIWYAECAASLAKAECTNDTFTQQETVQPVALTVDFLLKVHAEYKSTVPNNYGITMGRISQAVCEQKVDEAANAMAEWLKSLNRQYYRFRPAAASHLKEHVEPLIAAELTTILGFRSRRISTLTPLEEPSVRRLFDRFRPVLGSVGTGKALHVLAPCFFPLWDNP
jgi:hypothetical protein